MMNKSNEVLRTFLISLSVTLIMQLGSFADHKKWLLIGLLTILISVVSMTISYLVGVSAFNKDEVRK